MPSLCFYFQVHQPNRLKKYTFFEIGKDHFYEDDILNKQVLDKVAYNCYLPANKMLLDLIKRYNGNFKVAFSLSGVVIEQLEAHRPDVLESFKELVKTGCVEILGETYYHSLAFTFSKKEFDIQVKKHKDKVKEVFGVEPKVFRNTELIYNNELAAHVEKLGYKGVLSEGVDWYLNGRSCNQLYKAPNADKIKVLLKNFKLSDDIAFRFSDTNWSEYPLTPDKFSNWILESGGDTVNLFLDYEAIGEHQWASTGIFNFMEELPGVALSQGIKFCTPSESIKENKVKDVYDVHDFISWADTERNLSAWKGNTMQTEALDKIYGLEKYIYQSKNVGLLHVWRKLQTSDHYYYMSTKVQNDGLVHQYFSPYDSPYDAYIYFVNALSDLEINLDREGIEVYGKVSS